MAVTLVNDAQANHYVGLSGDAKPTTANVVAGARFIERDTGLEFIYDGSTWGEIGGAAALATAENPLPVDGGSPVLAAASDAIGTDSHRTAALTNTAVAISAAAGSVYGYEIHNPAAATTYWQVYNVAAASVTVGTTTPYKSIGIPAGATALISMPVPWSLGTAISHAATTTATGSTAPATALAVNVSYK
jgi:hypothetical protein